MGITITLWETAVFTALVHVQYMFFAFFLLWYMHVLTTNTPFAIKKTDTKGVKSHPEWP